MSRLNPASLKTGEDMSPFSDQVTYLALWLVLLLATALRFFRLGEADLWLDEVYYTIIAQQPLAAQILEPVETVSRLKGNDPILSAIPFSLALKIDTSNFVIRLPAALFGVATVALLYRLGRTLFSKRIGLVAALLLSVNSFHVLYSQEARSYSPFLFFCTASFWFFYRAVMSGRPKNWAWFIVFSWAGISSNYAMSFALAVQGLFIAVLLARDLLRAGPKKQFFSAFLRRSGHFFLAVALVFILRLPWLGALLFSVDHNTVGESYSLDLPGSIFQFWTSIAGSEGTPAVFLAAGVVLGLAWAVWRRPAAGLLISCWLILSVPVTALSVWYVGHFFHPRFASWSLPAVLLAAACAVIGAGQLAGNLAAAWLPHRQNVTLIRAIQPTVIAALLGLIVLVNLSQIQMLPLLKQQWPRGQLQTAADLIIARAAPHETLIHVGLPASHLQFFIEPVRQDLTYLDEETFLQQQLSRQLPAEMSGRWYLLHNSYAAPHIPEQWPTRQAYWEFGDIVVVHRPETCRLPDCLADTRRLLTEISTANPNSRLTERTAIILSRLTEPGF